MQKILYSQMNMKEFSINTCHWGLCDKRKRRSCEQKQKCLIRMMCNHDEEEIFGKLDWSKATNKKIDKHLKKEANIRRNLFKQCKPVEFIIRRKKK